MKKFGLFFCLLFIAANVSADITLLPGYIEDSLYGDVYHRDITQSEIDARDNNFFCLSYKYNDTDYANSSFASLKDNGSQQTLTFQPDSKHYITEENMSANSNGKINFAITDGQEYYLDLISHYEWVPGHFAGIYSSSFTGDFTIELKKITSATSETVFSYSRSNEADWLTYEQFSYDLFENDLVLAEGEYCFSYDMNTHYGDIGESVYAWGYSTIYLKEKPVCAVPAPGAMALSAMGMAFVGRLRRRLINS